MQIGDIIDKLEMFVALPRMASVVAGFNIDGPFWLCCSFLLFEGFCINLGKNCIWSRSWFDHWSKGSSGGTEQCGECPDSVKVRTTKLWVHCGQRVVIQHIGCSLGVAEIHIR